VEEALPDPWRAGFYVRHEIVHTKYVVEGLKAKVRFSSKSSTRCPIRNSGDLFRAWRAEGRSGRCRARKIFAIDATCPLVTKVHREAELHYRKAAKSSSSGHAGHPEVVGSLGAHAKRFYLLVQTPEEVEIFRPRERKSVWPM